MKSRNLFALLFLTLVSMVSQLRADVMYTYQSRNGNTDIDAHFTVSDATWDLIPTGSPFIYIDLTDDTFRDSIFVSYQGGQNLFDPVVNIGAYLYFNPILTTQFLHDTFGFDQPDTTFLGGWAISFGTPGETGYLTQATPFSVVQFNSGGPGFVGDQGDWIVTKTASVPENATTLPMFGIAIAALIALRRRL